MNARKLRGEIIKGAGVATRSLDPLFEEIRRRSGLHNLVPGTVNVRLKHWYPGHLDVTLLAHEHGHHEHLFLERCQLFGKDGLIVRTSTNFHGPAVLELMAQEHLKSAHGLDVGALLEIVVYDRGERRAKEVVP
jgi:hypothetical protein